MAALNPVYFITLSALLLLVLPPLSESLKIRPYRQSFQVNIGDGLPPNKVPLLVHCKSRDDDLGNHTLNVGDDYQFRFKMHFLRRTLFFCRMTWGAKTTSIDVFRGNFEGLDCEVTGNCRWSVRDDGFYFSGDKYPSWEKRHNWTGKAI